MSRNHTDIRVIARLHKSEPLTLSTNDLKSMCADSRGKTPAREGLERAGLGFDRLGAAGDLLPRQMTLTHFEDDGATPVPQKVTPPKKLDFQFERYEAILENRGNCISDHCPVKVWW